MIELQFDKARWSHDSDGVWLCVKAMIPRKAMNACDVIKPEKTYDLTIKEHRNGRSLNANSYLWVLIDKLADVLNDPGITKEDIYFDLIKRVGVSKLMTLPEDVASTLRVAWERLGIGWRTEQVDYDGKGNVIVRFYYGSSTYSTKQMSRLIDALVAECKEQGIETLTPEELARMTAAWTGERVNA